MTNSTIINVLGRKPRIIFPGKTVESFVGRPKKYLKYSALVIPLDTRRDAIVARMRITGKDPETKYIENAGAERSVFSTY